SAAFGEFLDVLHRPLPRARLPAEHGSPRMKVDGIEAPRSQYSSTSWTEPMSDSGPHHFPSKTMPRPDRFETAENEVIPGDPVQVVGQGRLGRGPGGLCPPGRWVSSGRRCGRGR